jgi:hypothetical protein
VGTLPPLPRLTGDIDRVSHPIIVVMKLGDTHHHRADALTAN